MNKCDKCGFLHYRTDPCRKPKESTEEKSDSPKAQHEALGNVAGVTQVAGSGVSPPVTRQAGTQALPVDTNNAESPNGRASDFESAGVGSIPASAPKFDKKTWMRDYMREHRKGLRRRAGK